MPYFIWIRELQQRQWRKHQLKQESNDFMIEFFCNSIRNFNGFIITSGPIPSPANSAMFFFIVFLPRSSEGEGETGVDALGCCSFFISFCRFSLDNL
jgi:hypothetical protein